VPRTTKPAGDNRITSSPSNGRSPQGVAPGQG
jgi:hypothetical protein